MNTITIELEPEELSVIRSALTFFACQSQALSANAGKTCERDRYAEQSLSSWRIERKLYARTAISDACEAEAACLVQDAPNCIREREEA
jgi:hypothetical protein